MPLSKHCLITGAQKEGEIQPQHSKCFSWVSFPLLQQNELESEDISQIPQKSIISEEKRVFKKSSRSPGSPGTPCKSKFKDKS